MNQNSRTRFILQLERIIASHCRTKNLNNGNRYRYPVHYVKNGVRYKTSGNGVANVGDDDIRTMKYTFASHTMEIGAALEEILDFMEKNCAFGPGLHYYDDETDDDDDVIDKGLY